MTAESTVGNFNTIFMRWNFKKMHYWVTWVKEVWLTNANLIPILKCQINDVLAKTIGKLWQMKILLLPDVGMKTWWYRWNLFGLFTWCKSAKRNLIYRFEYSITT